MIRLEDRVVRRNEALKSHQIKIGNLTGRVIRLEALLIGRARVHGIGMTLECRLASLGGSPLWWKWTLFWLCWACLAALGLWIAASSATR